MDHLVEVLIGSMIAFFMYNLCSLLRGQEETKYMDVTNAWNVIAKETDRDI